jgi:hypothetical protein
MTTTKTTASTATASTLGANAPGMVAHAFVRLRGEQTGVIDVYDARTPHARVTMRMGTVLMTFWSASAAQGVLEGISAARATLMHLPAASPVTGDPYGQPAVAIEWTNRPQYAAIAQSRVLDDQRRTLRWTDIHMGPLTWQLLDHRAFHTLVTILRDTHRTAVAVCLDGDAHRTDPTDDAYVPVRPGN